MRAISDSDRARVLEWLAAWPSCSTPVSVLEGFSGVGKSHAIREVLAASNLPKVYVSIPSGPFSMDDLLLELATELESLGFREMADAPEMNLRAGFEAAMRQSVLVIVDDFQYLLDARTHLPPADWLGLMQRVSSKPNAAGRLLLVTNIALPDGPWREHIEVRTLVTSVTGDGLAILEGLLSASARSDAIPATQRLEVVRWLGGNPRALQVLVGCLADDPLDELIGLDPLAWDLREQVVSPTLVQRLETRFLDRTLNRLDGSAATLVQYLACYRRPFTKDAIDRVQTVTGSSAESKGALTSRFLLEVHRNWYSLNPIARELALTQLNASGASKKAHGVAADHYKRHFTATYVDAPLKHSRELVEARHHLLASSRDDEFMSIAARFRGILLQTYGKTTALPSDEQEVAEMTLLLAALLSEEQGGYSDLRYLLARLLLARGRPGDQIVALRQTRIAVRESANAAIWVLYLNQLATLEGVKAMRSAAQEAYGRLAPGSLVPVFFAEAKMLGEAALIDDAIETVLRGIQRTQLVTNVPLYQLAVGLLLRHNEYERAIDLVCSALPVVDPAEYLMSFGRLLETGVYPALARRDSATITRIQQIIPWGERTQGHRALCDSLRLQAEDNYNGAAAIPLVEGERYMALRAAKVFSLLVAGDTAAAEAIHYGSQMAMNSAGEWLGGLLALAAGKPSIANAAFARSVGRPLSNEEIEDANLWIKIWDAIPAAIQTYPAFYFPRLPKALTGLAGDLVRHETTGSVLRSDLVSQIRLASRTVADSSRPPGGLVDYRGAGGSEPAIVIMNQVSPNFGSIAQTERIVMGDETYNVGQAGAVGRYATSTGASFSQVVGGLGDRDQLLAELKQLSAHLALGAVEEQAAAKDIEAAATTASQGDEESTKTYLRRAGKWALDAATSLGVALAAAAIRASMGM